ncbi:MAG: calcium/sodium antiporter [Saprospiraceae bacterium]
MPVFLYIAIFIVSIAVLLYASDHFVDAAERIGLAMGIPSFIIGVTIVAFGTSLPELATSIASIYSGASEVVVGNAVGSNITNILLVLGITAVVGKGIKIDYDVMNTDIPMLFGAAVLLYFSLLDLHLSTIECVLFLLALVVFLGNSFKGDGSVDESKEKTKIRPIDWGIVVVAGLFIYLGANYTIYSLTNIAESFNIPTHVIAITVVALGTSLPEVVVSINAAKKGKHAMAVGNVLGSNIFNTYAVMAIPGLMTDLKIPQETMDFSIPFMVFVTVIFGIICISKQISKWEGYMLLLFYAYFISTLLEKQIG